NHRPIPGNVYGTLRTTTIEFARSIGEQRADAVIEEALRDLPDHSWVSKRWYEPLWQPKNDLILRPRPVAVTASESRLELTPSGSEKLTFRIRTLSPE